MLEISLVEVCQRSSSGKQRKMNISFRCLFLHITSRNITQKQSQISFSYSKIHFQHQKRNIFPITIYDLLYLTILITQILIDIDYSRTIAAIAPQCGKVFVVSSQKDN
jgi:hypothetical protein